MTLTHTEPITSPFYGTFSESTYVLTIINVDLKAEQEGERRVININDTDVVYTLTVDPAVTGLKYEWDLNGDGDFRCFECIYFNCQTTGIILNSGPYRAIC